MNLHIKYFFLLKTKKILYQKNSKAKECIDPKFILKLIGENTKIIYNKRKRGK